mgnify:CR=1 FL=1
MSKDLRDPEITATGAIGLDPFQFAEGKLSDAARAALEQLQATLDESVKPLVNEAWDTATMPPGIIGALAPLGLLARARLRAVKFDEQHRRLGQPELRVNVDGAHGEFVEQFDARHRNAELNGFNGRIAGRLDTGKCTYARRHGFRNSVKPQAYFRNDSEGAFRSHQQPGEVITRRRLFGACACADDFTIRHDGCKSHDVLAHCAIAHRIGARGPRCRHAAKAGISPGINREEQPLVTQMCVERLAGNARLHPCIEISRIDR